MIFMGTGAAEQYPNPLCGCEQCKILMSSPQYRRKRSAFLIDERRMLDFGPDVLAAALQHGKSLAAVRHVFVTHAHNDHLSFDSISVLTMTKREPGDTMTFHMSKEAKAYCERYLELLLTLNGPDDDMNRLLREGVITFAEFPAYERQTIDGSCVVAVHSNHRSCGENERAFNYLIEREDGGKLFYVTDSGLYSEDNLKYLQNAGVTELIMEGTWGALPTDRNSGHLNADHFIENVANMRKYGVITEQTKIYMTHINPKHDLTHEAYQAYLDANAPQKVTVAWDGMEI